MSGPLALVYPVLAQIGWTFVVFIILGYRRRTALRNRAVRLHDLALSDDAWPDYARQASNNLRNQFETPVLFFALCGVATYIGLTSFWMVALAWIYVLCRVLHTIIHTTSNEVPKRALAFAIGAAALFLMWIGIVLALAFR